MTSLLPLLICVCVQQAALAFDCPEAPVQAKREWKPSVEATVGKLKGMSAGDLKINLGGEVVDLVGKLPNADAVYLSQMTFAAYCSFLKEDKSLSSKEKADRLAAYVTSAFQAFAASRPPSARDQLVAIAKQQDRGLYTRITNLVFTGTSQQCRDLKSQIESFQKVWSSATVEDFVPVTATQAQLDLYQKQMTADHQQRNKLLDRLTADARTRDCL